MIDEQFIRDLMQIYEEEYGEPISYEVAAREGQQLLFLYRTVFCKPLPSEIAAPEEGAGEPPAAPPAA